MAVNYKALFTSRYTRTNTSSKEAFEETFFRWFWHVHWQKQFTNHLRHVRARKKTFDKMEKSWHVKLINRFSARKILNN
ncbi:unnamed protein product [Acanthoscelides obtectus]|uniref:Uncharacterized protein n=1 Tax=Acanthoscelides obtectus TaxID=200917 RepID=A0A9P0L306_ACAOB|nr:unnamed protein product [Acanthoscelides obtectus]CAK1632832.1 hypothetical protein AOBTE_LOCUS7755 [Acanthoscelides obtectus]